MPGREYMAQSVSGYRFGFNTQEQDDEIYGKGNANSAQFWEYDSRLARRWNVDPLFKKRSDLSPFCVFNNNPICFFDNNGDSTAYYTATGTFLGTGNDNLPDAIVIISEDYFNSVMSMVKRAASPNDPPPSLDHLYISKMLRSLGKTYQLSYFKDFYKRGMSKKNLYTGTKFSDNTIREITDEKGNLVHNERLMYLYDIGGKIIPMGEETVGTPLGVDPDDREGVVATAHTHPEPGTKLLVKLYKFVEGMVGPRKEMISIQVGRSEAGVSGGPKDKEKGDIDNCTAEPGYLSVVVEKNIIYLYDSREQGIEFKNFKNAK